MKSSRRRSKTNRSTLRRIEIIIRRGWFPGAGHVSEFYKSTRRSWRNRTEAGNRVS